MMNRKKLLSLLLTLALLASLCVSALPVLADEEESTPAPVILNVLEADWTEEAMTAAGVTAVTDEEGEIACYQMAYAPGAALPTAENGPVREGAEFLGWIDVSGIPSIDVEDRLAAAASATEESFVKVLPEEALTDQIYMAVFSDDVKAPDAAGDYTISVDTEIVGGKVTADKAAAKAGDTVKLTVEAEENYKLETLSVVKADDYAVDVDADCSFTMPASDVTVNAVFKLDGEKLFTTFTDLDAARWYHDGIVWALSEGLMNGMGGDTFAPGATVTRAMVVTMLWRLEGQPEPAAPAAFTDVTDGSWYAKAVAWAAENGIVKGVSDTLFAPNSSLTREQMCTLLYRYAQTKGAGFTGLWSFKLDYTDADQLHDWAVEAVSWMTQEGLVQGRGGSAFAPREGATRAEIASLFQRFAAKLA